MAKIKIVGHQEFIDISDSEAKQLKKDLDSSSLKTDSMVNLGKLSVRVNQIKAILLSEDIAKVVDRHEKAYEEYYKERDRILSLSPGKRANVNAWGHFKLWYFGIYKTKPREDLKPRVLQKAIEFFETHSEWSKPSTLIWWDLMNTPKTMSMDGNVLRILERVEAQELRDIEDKITYKNLQKRKREIEEEALKKVEAQMNEEEINPDELFAGTN